MPITGTLAADFGSFYDAVQQSEVVLRSFDADAGKVAGSLAKMADSFSGRKIIAEATQMAAIFDDVKTQGTFTTAELQRMGTVGAEAAAKLRAMGQDVPPGIQRIATAATSVAATLDKIGAESGMQRVASDTREAAAAQETLGTQLGDVVKGFIAIQTARAAYNFASNILNEASALVDLSQQTHINIEDIQLLAGAMKEFGVDADTLAKGIFGLSRRIAGGDDSATHALALMGISLKQVDGLQGKDLFLKIEAGLATLQGSLRDTAASDLFGSRLGMAMAGASEGIGEAMAKAQELNTVFSGESARAMDEYSEAIERMEKSLTSMAANMIGPVAQGFNVVYGAATKLGSLTVFGAMVEDWEASLFGLGTGTEHLTHLLDSLNQKQVETAAAAKAAAAANNDVTAAVDHRTAAERYMATLEANAAVALTAAQLADLAHLKEIGQLTAANAEGIGVKTAQFNKYKAEMDAAKEATKKFAEAYDEITSAGDGWKGTLDGLNASTVEAIRFYLEAGVSQSALATLYGLTATQVKAVATALTQETAAHKLEAKAIEEVTKLWADYTNLIQREGTSAYARAGAAADQWATNTIAAAERAGTATAELYDAVAKIQLEEWRQAGLDMDAINTQLQTHTRQGLQETADQARRTYEDATRYQGVMADEEIQRFRDLADAAQLAADTFGTGFVQNGARAKHALDDTVSAAKAAADQMHAAFALAGGYQAVGVKGKLTDAQLRAAGYVDPLGHVTMLGEAMGYGFAGRAGGGPVDAGTPYMVGERGPELFVPSKGGTIVPNGAGGSRLTVNITVNGSVLGNKDEIARAVGDALMARLRAQGMRMPSNT